MNFIKYYPGVIKEYKKYMRLSCCYVHYFTKFNSQNVNNDAFTDPLMLCLQGFMITKWIKGTTTLRILYVIIIFICIFKH